MCFKPKDKCREWLGPEWLNHEDECEKKGFPACQEADNSFHGIRLAFRSATGFCHPLFGDLNILSRYVRFKLDLFTPLPNIRTYTLVEDPVRLGGSWRVGQEEIGQNGNGQRNDTVDD